jgi:hypothetical protein
MAGTTPAATTTQTTSHVSATAARSISSPPSAVPVAVLLAAAVGLAVSLLPSLAQTVWEVPHLFVLGLVISYGVFSQLNDSDVVDATGHAGDRNAAKDGGALAWNARYRPDEPLVVVADHAASDSAREGAMERPLSLPVRRLKPPPPTQESDTGDVSDGEETANYASSSGFWTGAHTVPSPSSVVLDTDLALSPCSPSFFAHGSATTNSAGFSGYHHPCTPRDDTFSEGGGEVAEEWDEDADGGSDGMTVSSERTERSSVRGDGFTASANDPTDGGVGDEKLLMLASKAAPYREDEVDRKADEFIAKFREQIRRQRLLARRHGMQ